MFRSPVPTPGNVAQLGDEHSGTRTRVLVADDNPRILRLVASLLGEAFDVIGLVSDGQSALDAVLELGPDLIILDILMPSMTGIEVAKALRKRSSTNKIVFLTVHQDAEILANCLAAGGLGYVTKELMDSDLIPAMNEALARRVFVSRF